MSASGGAFAVGFGELERWDPASYHGIAWHWPPQVMAPIGSMLRLRKEKVNRTQYDFASLQPITIHFDGTIDRREVEEGREYTMTLQFARHGDVVIAKIDLKNGAVGLAPDWENMIVTNHFAVYEPDRLRLVPEYLTLLIQTSFFKAYLWRNKVGAEGRKEVKLDFFESIAIPLPPLTTQRAIVARWQAAQAEADAKEERVRQVETEIETHILETLGLSRQPIVAIRKVVVARWSHLYHWSVRATQVSTQVGTLSRGKYPVVKGTDCLCEVKHGCSLPPAGTATGLDILKISAVTRGRFDPTERKFAQDSPRVRREFDLRQGDILMCRTNGTLGYVGMSGYVEHDMEDLIFPDKIIRVRTQESVVAEYLWRVLQLPHLRVQIEAAARTAVGNYAIGSDDIWSLQIPLPPLDVQRAIVERVQAGRAEIARLRAEAERVRHAARVEVEAMILGVAHADEARLDTI